MICIHKKGFTIHPSYVYTLHNLVGQKLCSNCRKAVTAQEAVQEGHSSPESGSPDFQEAGPSHSADPDVVGESEIGSFVRNFHIGIIGFDHDYECHLKNATRL